MRVKRGQVKRLKHKKVLAQTKGFRLTYSKLYRRAKEALLHSGSYNLAHRRKRQSQFRSIWIKRIAAVCKQNNTSYSKFIGALKKANVSLDRKVLSYLAYNHQFALDTLVKEVSK